MVTDIGALILAVTSENAELRAQLAQAQDLLVETALEAGDLQARNRALQAEVEVLQVERDAWRLQAQRRAG